MAQGVSQVTGTMTRFAAAFGVGFLAGGLTQLPLVLRSVVSEASGLAKVADKVGLTTTELQELRFAADLAGVGTSQLDVAMQRFSRRIAEAAKGSGELRKILTENNIELRNSDGSMRRQTDILADYANAIARAGSEQEQLRLAFKAFDTEGAALVNMLKGGASGLETLRREAYNAGGVLDEDVLRKAEEIDDEFAKLSRTIELNFKSGILASVSAMDALYESAVKVARLDLLGNAVGGGIASLLYDDKEILRKTFEAGLLPAGGQMFDRSGLNFEFAGQKGTRPLVPLSQRDFASRFMDYEKLFSGLPGFKKTGRGRKSDAERQAEQIKRVIKQLEFEAQQLARTTEAQELYNQLHAAGVDINSEAGQHIAELVEQNQRLEKANKRVEESTKAAAQAQQFFENVTGSALSSLIIYGEDAGDVMKRLAQQIAEAALQAALFGQGPFAGALGMPKGGIFGSLLGSLFSGFFAEGGSIPSGRFGIVGEAGPELVTGPATITPMTGSSVAVTIVNNAPVEVKTQETESGGSKNIDIFIDEIVAEKIGTPGSKISRTLQTRFALSGQLARR